MANDNVQIQMKLESVTEKSFSMTPDKIQDNMDPKELRIGFNEQIEPDVEKNLVNLVFGTRYVIHEDIVLESIYSFVFSVLNLKQFVTFNEGGSITVKDIMPHLLSVAVGTMRGILVVKTAGTSLSQFPLPIIDVNLLNKQFSVEKGSKASKQ